MFIILPVGTTGSPCLTYLSFPKTTIPSASYSKLTAMALIPSPQPTKTISPALILGNPCTFAIPSLIFKISPGSSGGLK
jgi:hypothetical protein